MKPVKTKKPTYAELERRLFDLSAQSLGRAAWALRDLPKASTSKLTASACVVSLTALGGGELVAPFAVRDGLSAETIAALKRDIQRGLDQIRFDHFGPYTQQEQNHEPL